MQQEREQFNENQDPRLENYNFPQLTPEVVERIVNYTEDKKGQFQQNYFGSDDIISKYRLARDLIQDGRFWDPKSLLDNFTHPNVEIPQQYKDLVKPLKDRLHFLLIQKGILPPRSMPKETSEKLLQEELRRRENFKDLIDEGWPIEVIGQMLTVDVFTDITDAKKLEEYRSWTTRSILREYLGVLAGKTTKKPMSIPDIMDKIPKRVFSDPAGIKFHLVENYIEQRLIRSVTDAGLHEGLANMENLVENTEDPNKKEFLQKLRDRFYNIATQPIGDKFKSEITLKGQQKTFPSFEQRTFCHDFTHNNTRLLAAETGLGKTGTAYLAMENSDANKVLVIAPASAKATWVIEDDKLFKEPGNVFTVEESSSDLKKAITSDKKYIVVSQELLGRTDHDPKLSENLEKLVKEAKVDGAIIDEIDNLNDPKAISTKTTIKLAELIRQNYAARTQKPAFDAPVIGLTATPIRRDLSDLDVAMGLLYPERYAVSYGDSTENRKTFKNTHLNRPDLAYYALVGEKRMFRWEQATGVQEFRPEPVVIEVSPFEEYLYTFVANEVPTDPLNKIRLLEDSLFNPLLVKAEVRNLAKGNIPDLDIDHVLRRLRTVANEWKKMKNIKEPKSQDDYLNADRLVELGMGDMVLNCFFSDLLENGIDTFVDELTGNTKDPRLKELRKLWKPSETSTKYKELRRIIEESLEWKIGPDGIPTRQKVFIVSPSRMQGRTGDVLQREIKDDNGDQRNLYTRYELDTINDSKLTTHVKEWTKDYCEEDGVLLLDGSVNVGRPRDRVIERWVNDPNRTVLIATLEATYQSRDFTLNFVEDDQGRRISGVKKIFLSPPWHYQQLKQMAGRSQRQGQLVPVDVKLLESRDLIDHGKNEAVLFTQLLSRMALSGIVLTPAEQEFFDSKLVGSRIPLQSPEARFLRTAFNFVRGAGEDRVEDYLKATSTTDGEATYDRLIAEKFFDGGRDEYKITGYNAEMVAYLTKHLVTQDSRILSIGAGTLLLQRKLKRDIDNVDINPHMMEAGWQEGAQYGGRKIVGRASRLSEKDFPTESYDLVDSSFSLDWSNLGVDGNPADSERVKILSQVHRVLKGDGKFILTLPERSLDSNRLEAFCNTLGSHFGFTIDKQFTGRSYGKSRIGTLKRLGWCIVANKSGDINLDGIDLKNLEFANETGEWMSHSPRKKRQTPDVRGGDYPTPDFRLQFDQYEIINDKHEVTVIKYEDDLSLPTESGIFAPDKEDDVLDDSNEPTILGLDFLRGRTKEEYHKEYRRLLLRQIMQITRKTWKDIEEVEAMCLTVFEKMQQKSGPINNRLIAYSLIVKEIKKRIAEVEGK